MCGGKTDNSMHATGDSSHPEVTGLCYMHTNCPAFTAFTGMHFADAWCDLTCMVPHTEEGATVASRAMPLDMRCWSRVLMAATGKRPAICRQAGMQGRGKALLTRSRTHQLQLLAGCTCNNVLAYPPSC
jgi:hypothetical protein